MNDRRHEKRDQLYLKRYGISYQQFLDMNNKQSGLCYICHLPETEKTSSGLLKQLSVDHSHFSGAVRSLLCSRCNHALGFAEKGRNKQDSISYLRDIINYIMKFEK